MAGEDALFQRFGKEFKRGEVLFREGDLGREMYVIQAGKVNITKAVRDTEKILATLVAGDFFGEMAIVANKPRSASAVMAEDGKLLVIDPRTFEAMIRGNTEIAVRMIKKLVDRLLEANEQIENLLLRDPASRLVHLLLQLSQRSGADTPQGRLVNVGIGELHGRLGLTHEAAQDALSKTARAKIIAIVPEGVLIPDLNKMRKYLEFLEMKERFGD